MEDLALGMTTIVLLFGMPFFIGLLVFWGWLINSNRKHRAADRARDTFERLAREKLDVIRTAIAMGQSDEQIRALDARLERLVGADKLAKLLEPRDPKPPAIDPELREADLLAEVDRLVRAPRQAQ